MQGSAHPSGGCQCPVCAVAVRRWLGIQCPLEALRLMTLSMASSATGRLRQHWDSCLWFHSGGGGGGSAPVMVAWLNGCPTARSLPSLLSALAPVSKSSEISEPSNYRGIAAGSVVAKG